MKNEKTFLEFTNQSAVQKTLKFQLLPLYETKKIIEHKNLFDVDEERAEYYPILKDICNEFYRAFIDERLSELQFEWIDLMQAYSENEQINLENQQAIYRKLISDRLQGVVDASGNKTKIKPKIPFNQILKSELITNILPDFIEKKDDGEDKEKAKKAISLYSKFTSRLTNFFESRKNIFTNEDISTSIAYRIVHDNFPLFMLNYQELQKNLPYIEEQLLELEKQLKKDKIITTEEKLLDYFTLNYFNKICIQSGIETYNTIIGGYTQSENIKIKGINEIINEKRQSIKKNQDENDEKIKLSKLTKLKKQILAKSDSSSFLIEAIEDDQDLFDKLEKFYQLLQTSNENNINILQQIQELPLLLKNSNLDQIFINAKYINIISHSVTSSKGKKGDWSAINKGLSILSLNQNSDTKTYLKAIENEEDLNNKRKQIYFSISELDAALEESIKAADENYFDISVLDYIEDIDYSNLEKEINTQYQAIQYLKNNDQKLQGNFDAIDIIKEFLDKVFNIYSKWKIFECEDKVDKDSDFYSQHLEIMEILENIIRLYNLTRNYLSQKPSAKKKIKINFNNPSLADGWSESKVSANNTIIFRKDEQYYLGILNRSPSYKELLKLEKNFNDEETEYYERLNYYFMPDAMRMIPKSSVALKEVREYFQDNPDADSYLIQNNSFKKPFSIPREIYDMQYVNLYDGKKMYQKDYLKKTGDQEGYRDALNKWIDFCKEFISVYEGRKYFDYSELMPTDLYQDLNEFYTDVDAKSFKMGFSKISSVAVRNMVKEEKLLLFQIYNKDFSDKSKGKPNLFTIYWKALFSDENLKLNKIRLNGQAEIFFRQKQIKEAIRHKKDSFVVNRFDVEGNIIPEKIYKEIKDYKNGLISEESLSKETKLGLENNQYKYFQADYEIIKDRRYTENRLFFHVPISFNWDIKLDSNINDLAKKYIYDRDDIHIIGIDRGENHLLYYTVINLNGEIVEQGSLNSLSSFSNKDQVEKTIPYHEMLKKREKERADARVSWHSIEKIKDLKEGYLSQVVHFLTNLIMKYNAIIILEDLNYGFKRGRFKVERQVYQKFEIALMNKLNCLIFKDKVIDELGGALYPLQLCKRVDAYKNIGRQNGIIFYVPAAYTSKVDPITGFANLFEFKRIKNSDFIKFFEKFDEIKYHQNEDVFSFSFDYKNMSEYVKTKDLKKTKWKIYSNSDRYFWNKKEGNCQVDLTKKLKEILTKFELDYANNPDILTQFVNMKNDLDKKNLSSELMWLFKLIVKIRNNDQLDNPDFIISPVKDEQGHFFDSRENIKYLPENGDANGAYNIARKGLLYREQLIDSLKTNKRATLRISNKEWFDYISK